MWSDDQYRSMFGHVDNSGRWGADDELGTINFITPEKRVSAAALVEAGITVSLSHALGWSERGSNEIEWHGVHTSHPDPVSGAPPFAGDSVSIEVHQQGVTHLDSVSHIGSHHSRLYNDRAVDDTIGPDGIRQGSIGALAQGIVTRGVLLDLPLALGVDWLEPAHEVVPSDLEAAEVRCGVKVSSGDALILRTGVERLESELGNQALVCGPGPEAAVWMHDREVALYGGDAPDHIGEAGARILGRLPWPEREDGSPTTQFPLPFHQIAIPGMGMPLLDHAAVEELAATCRRLGRYEFLIVVSPLVIPGGTGSPVNPLAIF